MYKEIYENLVNSRTSTLKRKNIHKHHIIPKHSGGSDSKENICYLTPREHQIAHFLLWKIYNNVNDLRSMKMLGARLTTKQRKHIGNWCKDNNVGFFSEKYRNDKRANKERCKKAALTQRKNKVGTFDPIVRSKIASLGGKKGSAAQMKTKSGIHNPDNWKHHASLGGKAIKGMICMTNGTTRTRVKPENIEEYLKNGYKKGFTLSSNI